MILQSEYEVRDASKADLIESIEHWARPGRVYWGPAADGVTPDAAMVLACEAELRRRGESD